jgi:DNA helicase-4
MGVAYKYEDPYKLDTADAAHRQYTPDFYLPDHDIYIEHFALDNAGQPPSFMNQAEYLDGVRWKRALHQQYGTKLIETFSYEQANRQLLTRLEEKLKSLDVVFSPVPDDRLLDKINSIPQASELTRLLADLINAFKMARWKMAEFMAQAKHHAQQLAVSVLLKIFEPVLDRYQAYLKERRSIDFEDMINLAIDCVRAGAFRSPYRFILVDEFQDISAPRAELIKSLLAQHTDNSLFCVGDDWQAIYRFAGSDVSYTKEFSRHFGFSAINALDTTYRFNDKIGSVASRFVQSNADQIKKKIDSLRQVHRAAVTLINSGDEHEALTIALAAVAKQAEIGATVLLLARFKFRLPKDLKKWQANFPQLKLQAMSVHASKGKEADYVIVMGLDQGEFGFPSQKSAPALLEMLLPRQEEFAFAEERRLFYVALTRARHHVYLISNPQSCSVFARELRTYGNEIEQVGADGQPATEVSEDPSCPNCKSGYLIARATRNSRSFVCSNHPYCEHTQRGCRQCGGPMRRGHQEWVCERQACGERVRLCPLCGGILLERKGAWGSFLGCSNDRKDDPRSCRYKAQGSQRSSFGERLMSRRKP